MNMHAREFSPIQEIGNNNSGKEVFKEVPDAKALAEMIAIDNGDGKQGVSRKIIEDRLIAKFNALQPGEQATSYYEGKKVTVQRTEKGFDCTIEPAQVESLEESADEDTDIPMAA